MKTVKFAAVILIITLLAVIVNSVIIAKMIDETIEDIETISNLNIDEKHAEYSRLYSSFKEKQKIISLTVNHTDMTVINESFAELIGATEAHDTEATVTIESRLVDALKHLKRLSGFNIDSIL